MSINFSKQELHKTYFQAITLMIHLSRASEWCFHWGGRIRTIVGTTILDSVIHTHTHTHKQTDASLNPYHFVVHSDHHREGQCAEHRRLWSNYLQVGHLYYIHSPTRGWKIGKAMGVYNERMSVGHESTAVPKSSHWLSTACTRHA